MIAPAGGNAVTINAGPNDVIHLRGLTIEGALVGLNGIVLNSGGFLTVTNCLVQRFSVSSSAGTGNGILIQPTTGSTSFIISNTIVTGNLTDGIAYLPPSDSPHANGVIDHVVATANGNNGIEISTGAASGSFTVVAISNTVASNNVERGLQLDNGNGTPFLAVSIDNASVTGNGTGILANGRPTVLLGRSVVTLNSIGVENQTQTGTFFTYKDNRINANPSGTDISSPLNGSLALQ